MENYTYTDECDNTITIQSNYGHSFNEAFNYNIHEDEVVNISIIDEYEKMQEIGLSLSEIKNLISYLNNLIKFFEK